ncbi:MAG TPA: hypothetical protein VF658_01260 [Pyrinomonadaceae bacterium]|jgi:hypothetical protein
MQKINIKCAIALALLLVCTFVEANAAAKKKTKAIRPTYGRIEVTASYPERPAGSTNTYPILVNGKQVAMTAPDLKDVQYIDLQPGQYTVEVVFPNRTHRQVVDVVAGKRHCICLTYSERAKPCIPPGSLTVNGPASVAEGEPITFTSDVTYEGSSALNYTWTVSPGSVKILSGGSGSREITVSSEGLGSHPITAILVVDDGSGDSACRRTAQKTVDLIVIEDKIPCFDCIPDVTNDDLKARLDNFAIELQNIPDAKGYIYIYTGQYLRRAGNYERREKFIRDYMVNTRRFDSSRLVIQNGGYRSTSAYDLFIVPQGRTPPQATPSTDINPEITAPPTNERPRRSRRSRRDE